MSRQPKIVQRLTESGFQSVTQLADAFGVTASTVRRDLEQLEARQLVQRTHGGALPVKASADFDMKGSQHRREKAAIGAAMAERIRDGQTVLLDSGTTSLEVARHLTRSRLTVVTNDLQIGLTIAQRRSARLLFIGGELLSNDVSMWGPTAVQQLHGLRVDVTVAGCDAVMHDGIYSTSSYEIELKRAMIAIANEAYIVADSSKFGRDALFRCSDLAPFTAAVTDENVEIDDFPLPLVRAAL
jgi:DeoR/GlpR family transcriptional regulator of sugar metabolism